jgi:hypothetical protein
MMGKLVGPSRGAVAAGGQHGFAGHAHYTHASHEYMDDTQDGETVEEPVVLQVMSSLLVSGNATSTAYQSLV